MLRVALRKHQHLKVVHVDKLAGFTWLDWIVMNEHSSDTWRLGIQVKKNVRTGVSWAKATANAWGGTSAVKLYHTSNKLEKKFGTHKQFALVTSYAWRQTPREKARWDRLVRRSNWDVVCVFESRRIFKPPYTYNLSLDKFDNIVRMATG